MSGSASMNLRAEKILAEKMNSMLPLFVHEGFPQYDSGMRVDVRFEAGRQHFVAHRHANFFACSGETLRVASRYAGHKANTFIHDRTLLPRHHSPKGKECHPCARYKLSPMCRAAHQSRAIRMSLISYPCYRSTAKKQLVPRMTASRPAIRTNSSRPQLFLLQR